MPNTADLHDQTAPVIGPDIGPDPDSFRRALRRIIGQVSVLTLGADSGAPNGLTLTSAHALSTEPPLLIACVNRAASSHGLLRMGGRVGWQVLGAAQQSVADRFAGKGGATGAARFEGADWRMHLGAQLLDGAALSAAAQIESLSDHASHTVVIARILSLTLADDAGVLAYRDGAYLPLP